MTKDIQKRKILILDTCERASFYHRLCEISKYSVEMEFADTYDKYLICLKESSYDVIMADYKFLGTNARAYLEPAGCLAAETPFIFMLGNGKSKRDKKLMTELISSGAADCIPAGDPDEAAFAIYKALGNAPQTGRNEASKIYARLIKREKLRFMFERRLLTLALQFINAPLESLAKSIVNSMELIADYCEADRVIACRYDWNIGVIQPLFEWDKKPSYNLGGSKTKVLSEDSEEVGFHKKGKAYIWHNRDRTYQDMVSMCSCPIIIRGELAGMIALSTVKRKKQWRKAEIGALKEYCELMANVLQREENEKSVRELNEKHRLILDALDEGVGMLDSSGTFLSANRHLAQKNNKSIEEMIGTKIDDYMFFDTGEMLKQRKQDLNRVFETGEPVFHVEEFGGMWAHNRLYPIFKDGEVSSVALVSTDITDRKRIEDEIGKNALLEKEAEMLRKKEREYLEILDGSSLSSWIYDVKTNTLMLSSKWKKRIGAEHVSDEEMSEYVDGLVHPDDLQGVVREREQVIMQKSYQFRIGYRHKVADGGYIWVLDQGKVEYDKNGMPERIYGTTVDVTDKVNADVKLRAVKDDLAAEVEALNIIHSLELNLIVQNDPDIIYREILNSAISVTSAQKGCVGTYLSDEDALKTIYAINMDCKLPDVFDSIPAVNRIRVKLLEDKKRIVIDDIGKYLNENENPVLEYLINEGVRKIQFTPLMSSTGKLIGVLNTCHCENREFHSREIRMLDMLSHMAADAIERIDMENALLESKQHALALVEELKKTDKNKNEFISILSHELRNPLAALDSGLMLLGTSKNEYERENAKVIMRRQIDYLRGLVDDLLDLTRISQNMLKLKKEKVDICQIAAQATADIRPQFQAKNIRLIENIEKSPIYLDADPLRMTQVVENLLSNALKFTESGGLIVLCVAREDDHVTVSVADNGIGIGPEILPGIFEAFTQADNALAKISGGLGLGLAIAKNIAQLHGGNIEARSEGAGKGSVFILRLPVLPGFEKTPQKSMKNVKSGTPVSILLIEDNKSLAEMQSALFRHMGHDVTAVHNGYEGIREAIEKRPDIILCDIGIPGISGYDVARSIRKNALLDDTILVALTGYASEDVKKTALESGFDMHLSKPVSTEVLERVFSKASYKKQKTRTD